MGKFLSQGFKPGPVALENQSFVLVGTWGITGTGAVTVPATDGGLGLALTRTGVGAYTVALRYNAAAASVPSITYFNANIVDNSNTFFKIKWKTVASNPGSLTFQVLTDASPGVATDPPNPSQITVQVFGKRSNAKR